MVRGTSRRRPWRGPRPRGCALREVLFERRRAGAVVRWKPHVDGVGAPKIWIPHRSLPTAGCPGRRVRRRDDVFIVFHVTLEGHGPRERLDARDPDHVAPPRVRRGCASPPALTGARVRRRRCSRRVTRARFPRLSAPARSFERAIPTVGPGPTAARSRAPSAAPPCKSGCGWNRRWTSRGPRPSVARRPSAAVAILHPACSAWSGRGVVVFSCGI